MDLLILVVILETVEYKRDVNQNTNYDSSDVVQKMVLQGRA